MDEIEDSAARAHEDYELSVRREELGGHIRGTVTSVAVAVAASALYVAAYSASMVALGNEWDYNWQIALALIGPMQLIIALYKLGFRPPFVAFGGIIGLAIDIVEVVLILFLPVVPVFVAGWLGQQINAVIPAFPEGAIVLVMVFWPVLELAYAAVQGVRWALMGREPAEA